VTTRPGPSGVPDAGRSAAGSTTYQRHDIAAHSSRVLIVDDERHNRHLLKVLLEPEGYVVDTAATGEEALAMVARRPPDLILLDIMMPGMDGYAVAGKLKGYLATRNIPIIMVTALDDRVAKMRGLNAGAEDFLSKPVDRAELCVRVRNLVRLKAYGDYHDKYSQILEGEVGARTAELVERAKALEQQTAVLTEQAALLDLAQDAIVVLDMRSRILFWNRGAEAMYGWRKTEVLGLSAADVLQSASSESAEHIDDHLLRHGQWTGEAVHHKRDGTSVNVACRWTLQRDAAGAPVRILTIANDLSERKQAICDLMLLAERLSLATAVARVGVSEWHRATNLFTWDATMFEIYGIDPIFRLPHQRWAAAIHPEDRAEVEAKRQQAIDTKGEASAEFRVVLTDGTTRTVSAVERVVLDDSANVTRVIGVHMDVTERQQAAQALEQSRQDQMRFKDEFLSHVSHELRSPLSAIKQFSTILLGGLAGELNKEQREYQLIVLNNIRQLQSMIDDLLEVTRLETGKLTVELESVSVADAVTDSLNTLQVTARAKGITLSSDRSAVLPPAHADQTRLRQILIILLDNAIKFTAAGGAVNIQARLLEHDPQFLLLEVSDTGCGLGQEMASKIFERLYQVSEPVRASRKGLGLGLFICKELVTRQGGLIWVKSHEHKGSTFSFTLPVFSLKNVIAPLLKNGRWPAESVALVMVDIRAVEGWSSKQSQNEWTHEARSLLERCLLPDLDVLLPRMCAFPKGECFFVAVFTGEKGATVLANRIREQFERLPYLKQTGRTLTVSHRMLQPFPRHVDASMDVIVASMATHLEQAIASQISQEAAGHDQ
jgi:PAS domain S-box-containing protein